MESLPGRKHRLSDVRDRLSSELYAQPSSLIFKVLYLLHIAESVLDAVVVCTCPCTCEAQSTTLWSRISSSTLTWLPEFKCKRLRLVQQAPLPTRQLSSLFSLHNVAGISESCRWFLCFHKFPFPPSAARNGSCSSSLTSGTSKVSLQRTFLMTLSEASFSLPYITVFPSWNPTSSYSYPGCLPMSQNSPLCGI